MLEIDQEHCTMVVFASQESGKKCPSLPIARSRENIQTLVSCLPWNLLGISILSVWFCLSCWFLVLDTGWSSTLRFSILPHLIGSAWTRSKGPQLINGDLHRKTVAGGSRFSKYLFASIWGFCGWPFQGAQCCEISRIEPQAEKTMLDKDVLIHWKVASVHPASYRVLLHFLLRTHGSQARFYDVLCTFFPSGVFAIALEHCERFPRLLQDCKYRKWIRTPL